MPFGVGLREENLPFYVSVRKLPLFYVFADETNGSTTLHGDLASSRTKASTMLKVLAQSMRAW